MFVFVWQDLINMFQVMTRGVACSMRCKRPFPLLVLFGLMLASIYLVMTSAMEFVPQMVVIWTLTFEFEKVVKVSILWKMFLRLSCL